MIRFDMILSVLRKGLPHFTKVGTLDNLGGDVLKEHVIWGSCLMLSAVLTGCFLPEESTPEPQVTSPVIVREEAQETEQFVRTHLMNDRGEIRTNVTDRSSNYLSESLGLWLHYLVTIEDEQTVRAVVETIARDWERDGWLPWERTDGTYAMSNASLDDGRLLEALLRASDRWEISQLEVLTDSMSQSWVDRHLTKGGWILDYYDAASDAMGDVVTTSYLIAPYVEGWVERGLVSVEQYEALQQYIQRIPTDADGHLANRYIPSDDRFEWNEEMHAIDELYALYYLEAFRDLGAMKAYWRERLLRDEQWYGRYKRADGTASVPYESAAVYALGRLVYEGDEEVERLIEARIRTLRHSGESDSMFEGAFVDLSTEDVHAFDHLLILLTEGKGRST